MNEQEDLGKQLLGTDQVINVGSRVAPASQALAIRENRTAVTKPRVRCNVTVIVRGAKTDATVRVEYCVAFRRLYSFHSFGILGRRQLYTKSFGLTSPFGRKIGTDRYIVSNRADFENLTQSLRRQESQSHVGREFGSEIRQGTYTVLLERLPPNRYNSRKTIVTTVQNVGQLIFPECLAVAGPFHRQEHSTDGVLTHHIQRRPNVGARTVFGNRAAPGDEIVAPLRRSLQRGVGALAHPVGTEWTVAARRGPDVEQRDDGVGGQPDGGVKVHCGRQSVTTIRCPHHGVLVRHRDGGLVVPGRRRRGFRRLGVL